MGKKILLRQNGFSAVAVNAAACLLAGAIVLGCAPRATKFTGQLGADAAATNSSGTNGFEIGSLAANYNLAEVPVATGSSSYGPVTFWVEMSQISAFESYVASLQAGAKTVNGTAVFALYTFNSSGNEYIPVFGASVSGGGVTGSAYDVFSALNTTQAGTILAGSALTVPSYAQPDITSVSKPKTDTTDCQGSNGCFDFTISGSFPRIADFNTFHKMPLIDATLSCSGGGYVSTFSSDSGDIIVADGSDSAHTIPGLSVSTSGIGVQFAPAAYPNVPAGTTLTCAVSVVVGQWQSNTEDAWPFTFTPANLPTGSAAPALSLTVSGPHGSNNAMPGDVLAFSWSAVNLGNVSTYYYANAAMTCIGGYTTQEAQNHTTIPWVNAQCGAPAANGLESCGGGNTAVVQGCQAGVTYTIGIQGTDVNKNVQRQEVAIQIGNPQANTGPNWALSLQINGADSASVTAPTTVPFTYTATNLTNLIGYIKTQTIQYCVGPTFNTSTTPIPGVATGANFIYWGNVLSGTWTVPWAIYNCPSTPDNVFTYGISGTDSQGVAHIAEVPVTISPAPATGPVWSLLLSANGAASSCNENASTCSQASTSISPTQNIGYVYTASGLSSITYQFKTTNDGCGWGVPLNTLETWTPSSGGVVPPCEANSLITIQMSGTDSNSQSHTASVAISVGGVGAGEGPTMQYLYVESGSVALPVTSTSITETADASGNVTFTLSFGAQNAGSVKICDETGACDAPYALSSSGWGTATKTVNATAAMTKTYTATAYSGTVAGAGSASATVNITLPSSGSSGTTAAVTGLTPTLNPVTTGGQLSAAGGTVTFAVTTTGSPASVQVCTSAGSCVGTTQNGNTWTTAPITIAVNGLTTTATFNYVAKALSAAGTAYPTTGAASFVQAAAASTGSDPDASIVPTFSSYFGVACGSITVNGSFPSVNHLSISAHDSNWNPAGYWHVAGQTDTFTVNYVNSTQIEISGLTAATMLNPGIAFTIDNDDSAATHLSPWVNTPSVQCGQITAFEIDGTTRETITGSKNITVTATTAGNVPALFDCVSGQLGTCQAMTSDGQGHWTVVREGVDGTYTFTLQGSALLDFIPTFAGGVQPTIAVTLSAPPPITISGYAIASGTNGTYQGTSVPTAPSGGQVKFTWTLGGGFTGATVALTQSADAGTTWTTSSCAEGALTAAASMACTVTMPAGTSSIYFQVNVNNGAVKSGGLQVVGQPAVDPDSQLQPIHLGNAADPQVSSPYTGGAGTTGCNWAWIVATNIPSNPANLVVTVYDHWDQTPRSPVSVDITSDGLTMVMPNNTTTSSDGSVQADWADHNIGVFFGLQNLARPQDAVVYTPITYCTPQ